MKITMNVNDDLLERVDRYAKQNYLTRTSVFSFAASQFLISQEMPSMMANLNNALVKIAETGEITPKEQSTLDALQLFVEALQSGKIEVQG